MTVQPPSGAADDELDPSDEALTWDGERDASHVAGPKPTRARPARTRSDRAPDPAADGVTRPDPGPDAAQADRPAPTSSFLLVTYGILAGAYGLYAIGWITAVLRSTITFPDLLGEFMYQFGEFLAIAAAPVWFAAVFALTRGKKPIVRLLWLLLGLVLLVPVPFVLGA